MLIKLNTNKYILLIVASYLIYIYISIFTKTAFAFDINSDTWEFLPTQSKIDTMVVTPSTIIAGEKSNSIITPNANGVKTTNNLGQDWFETQMVQKQIYGLDYTNGYSLLIRRNDPPSFYISENNGITWENKNFTQSLSALGSYDNKILLGTNSHGVFLTTDYGQSYEKVSEASGQVVAIDLNDKVGIFSTFTNTYISNDLYNWQPISNTLIQQASINTIDLSENIILLGSNMGLFLSLDQGETWQNPQALQNVVVKGLHIINNSIYAAGEIQRNDLTYTIMLKSDDLGTTWQDLHLDIQHQSQNINISHISADTNILVVALSELGLYYKLDQNYTQINSFLDLPWDISDVNSAITKITSVFDHEYPLLGYKYHLENEENTQSTVDFFGVKSSKAYSTHNGIDFGVSFGTPVKAASSGYATYNYCTDCGNTIEIDHLNGYQTNYMHLQNQGLVTNNQVPKWVNSGDIIGYVGLTGRTTGPHIHFGVKKDTNLNGQFIDEFPHGNVDPFGWLNSQSLDPWPNYSWSDIFGSHSGTNSSYLWNELPESVEKYIIEPQSISFDNFDIDIQNPSNSILNIKKYIVPFIPNSQNNLKYITNSSVIVSLTNNFGQKISTLPYPVNIKVFFDPLSLVNTSIESLKLYHFNQNLSLWEPLQNQILDLQNNTISADAFEFSQFAVFGQKLSTTPPTTTLTITGEMQNGWYTQYPTVHLSSNQDTDTYYSIDNDYDWVQYINPFTIDFDGPTTIFFKSQQSEIWEQTQTTLVKIDTKNNPKDKAKVTSNTFTMKLDF